MNTFSDQEIIKRIVEEERMFLTFKNNLPEIIYLELMGCFINHPKDIAQKYFTMFAQKEGIIPAKFLDLIEIFVEQQGNHVVEVIAQTIETEN